MAEHEPEPDDPLVPVPVPALGVLLLAVEGQKCAPLTQQEVLQVRDSAVCIVMPLSVRTAMEAKRGYRDIDPENVWKEWLIFRAQAAGDS